MGRFTYPRFQALQPPPKLRQLRRSHEYQAKLLHNNTSEFEVLKKQVIVIPLGLLGLNSPLRAPATPQKSYKSSPCSSSSTVVG